MPITQPLGRRLLLAHIGRTAFGIVVMGTVTACTTADGGAGRPSSTASGADWQRVDLGFVSAYILVRAGEAAIVDTGVEGSADDIEGGLVAAGLDWGAVAHVILTHKHADHVGSAAAVLERAADATPYAGHADIAAIDVPRQLITVADDDEVFGLQVITTPGHTPGHISVLDRAGGVLVVGDAMVGADGGVAGPDPQFTEDMDTAHKSVRKLTGYTFETALFGHGEPVASAADAQVAALSERLADQPFRGTEPG